MEKKRQGATLRTKTPAECPPDASDINPSEPDFPYFYHTSLRARYNELTSAVIDYHSRGNISWEYA
jgi:hypothetical protein